MEKCYTTKKKQPNTENCGVDRKDYRNAMIIEKKKNKSIKFAIKSNHREKS
jgi:hypothetical protein